MITFLISHEQAACGFTKARGDTGAQGKPHTPLGFFSCPHLNLFLNMRPYQMSGGSVEGLELSLDAAAITRGYKLNSGPENAS